MNAQTGHTTRSPRRRTVRAVLGAVALVVPLGATEAFVASSAGATTPGAPLRGAPCPPDPATNTHTIQSAIDHAHAGDTIVLAAGDCVVAKCDVATHAV